MTRTVLDITSSLVSWRIPKTWHGKLKWQPSSECFYNVCFRASVCICGVCSCFVLWVHIWVNVHKNTANHHWIISKGCGCGLVSWKVSICRSLFILCDLKRMREPLPGTTKRPEHWHGQMRGKRKSSFTTKHWVDPSAGWMLLMHITCTYVRPQITPARSEFASQGICSDQVKNWKTLFVNLKK